MKVLVIDNYDSFTYNLVQLIAAILKVSVNEDTVRVYRNNTTSLSEIEAFAPDKIIISPGPGGAENGGISKAIIERFSPHTTILGVCLGHQIIGDLYGAKIVRAPQPVHGKTSLVTHVQNGIFSQIPIPTTVCRYHSLCIQSGTLPDSLTATAHSEDGVVMGIEHRSLPIYGVQFHPESFLSTDGKQLMTNFLELS